MLFDSHAHYDDEKFDVDRVELLKKINEEGVTYIINVGADLKSSVSSVELSKQFNFIYASVGVHPHEAKSMDDKTIDQLALLSKNKKVVAFGEIGLDYYYDNSPRDLQKYWFAKQLDLAAELKLPVIIHIRDAYEDAMEVIKKSKPRDKEGVIHCFSGSVETAKLFLNQGFTLSVGGVLTFKNARKVREVVAYIPEDMILIETDCPYMSPEPHRSKRNHSGYLKYVAEKMAEIKGISFEETAYKTLVNAKRVFNIL